VIKIGLKPVVWRKFETIETCSMKTILSFLRSVKHGWNQFKQEMVILWRFNKPSFFPTDKNLIVSFWYGFVYFKDTRAAGTVYDFLDERRASLRRALVDPDELNKKKQFYHDLLDALDKPHLRKIFIDFLESPSPEENYKLIINVMKSAWRSNEEIETPRLQEEDAPEKPIVSPEVPSLKAVEPAVPLPEADQPKGKRKLLNARAYFIAASLHFEMQGRSAEFRQLSMRLKDLKNFITQQFHVTKLPGTFDELTGYKYKDILNGENPQPKAQLKQNFQQIVEHPEIFGKAIADRAAEIMDEHYY
jgi:hypothetical protein